MSVSLKIPVLNPDPQSDGGRRRALGRRQSNRVEPCAGVRDTPPNSPTLLHGRPWREDAVRGPGGQPLTRRRLGQRPGLGLPVCRTVTTNTCCLGATWSMCLSQQRERLTQGCMHRCHSTSWLPGALQGDKHAGHMHRPETCTQTGEAEWLPTWHQDLSKLLES